MRNRNSVKVRRDHKDTLFRMIFSTRENLLSLYNAVNHSHYTDAKELEIVTLENAAAFSDLCDERIPDAHSESNAVCVNAGGIADPTLCCILQWRRGAGSGKCSETVTFILPEDR